MPRIRFASTDAGLRLLHATLRHSMLATRAAHIVPGRIHQSVLGPTDPRELALQSGFLRLVSITEATVDALANEVSAGEVPNANQTVRLLMLEKELAGSSNWQARRKSYRRHHKVDIRKCDDFKLVEGSIDVRNAIAHGLGRLTTQQTNSLETPRHLAAVKVTVVNGFVELDPEHLKECARYSASFLRSLDNSLP